MALVNMEYRALPDSHIYNDADYADNDNGNFNANEFHLRDNSNVRNFGLESLVNSASNSKESIAMRSKTSTATQSYATDSCCCNPRKSELKHNIRFNLDSYNAIGMSLNNGPRMQHNIGFDANTLAQNMKPNAATSFASSYDNSSYEDYNGYNDSWSVPNSVIGYNDILESQSVYRADFRPITQSGNNFNHFPNDNNYMNMNFAADLNGAYSSYTNDPMPLGGNYGFDGVAGNMCGTQVGNMYDPGSVNGMQMHYYSN